MLLRQFCFRNNLPTHIKENLNFRRQKPRQLLSAEANFEGCSFEVIVCIYLTRERFVDTLRSLLSQRSFHVITPFCFTYFTRQRFAKLSFGVTGFFFTDVRQFFRYRNLKLTYAPLSTKNISSLNKRRHKIMNETSFFKCVSAIPY